MCTSPFERFLELCVFPYLKRCPKLKLVKITNIFVNMDSDFYEVLGSLLVNFNSASLKELHLKFLTLRLEVLDSAPFLQAVKNFFKKVTENKPKLQYLGLYLNSEINGTALGLDTANVKKICQEIASEKKVKIELFVL